MRSRVRVVGRVLHLLPPQEGAEAEAVSAPARIVSSEAKATLAFACDLLLNRLMAGVGSDRDTVFEPMLISWVRPVAEFTLSAESGTFRVTVERVGEEMQP